MLRTDAIAWVLTVGADSLRLSQARTLSVRVAAAMRVQRISLANIGRAMFGGRGIQCSTTAAVNPSSLKANHSSRKTKALAEPRLRTWLECGGRFELWSWAKQGERGKRKLWALRREEVAPDQVQPA